MPDEKTQHHTGPASPLTKFAVLRQQHAKLHAERDHMLVNVKRNIIAGFQRALGGLDHAQKKAECEVSRLKREIELLRAASRRGEVDYNKITSALEREFKPREQLLGDTPRQMDWAFQRLNTMMTAEQTSHFQARYRRLVEQLHPDLRLEPSVTADNLWNRARESFAAGDAAELEAIELLAEDLPRENLAAHPAALIEQRVAQLKQSNSQSINEISALRLEWPFHLATKLPDENWLKTQRQEYNQKTLALLRERDSLNGELNRLLDSGPTGAF